MKTLLFYYESTCSYCKRFEAMIDKYTSKNNIECIKYRVDKKEGLEDIKNHLNELPYFIFKL